MPLHADPVVWVLRFYSNDSQSADEQYRNRVPFDAVVSVMLAGETAWLYALHGKFDRGMWREIETWLRERGVNEARMERGGTLKIRN